MTIVFEEPKAPADRSKRWRGRLDPLKEHPGAWARVFVSKSLTAARQYVSALDRQNRYALPDGEFEFMAGELDDGRGAVYARFVGEA